MWRYLVGAITALLLAGGGVLLWRGGADARPGLPLAPRPMASSTDPVEETPEPPAASDKTREERRFSRYDKDKDGAVAREEWLASRRKAFAKLDADGDGRLSFDEWAVKTTAKFTGADKDRDGRLMPGEFVTTRVVRKAKPKTSCPPVRAARDDDESAS